MSSLYMEWLHHLCHLCVPIFWGTGGLEVSAKGHHPALEGPSRGKSLVLRLAVLGSP